MDSPGWAADYASRRARPAGLRVRGHGAAEGGVVVPPAGWSAASCGRESASSACEGDAAGLRSDEGGADRSERWGRLGAGSASGSCLRRLPSGDLPD